MQKKERKYIFESENNLKGFLFLITFHFFFVFLIMSLTIFILHSFISLISPMSFSSKSNGPLIFEAENIYLAFGQYLCPGL